MCMTVCNNPAWPVPAPATSVTSSRNAQVNISNVHSASGPLPGENLFPPGASAVRDGSPKGTLVISPSPSAPAMSPPMERGMSDSDACSKGKPLILARRSRPLPIPPRLPLSSPSRTPDSCFNTQSAYDYWPASPSHQKTYRRLPPIPISTPLQPPFPTSPSSSVMITPPATLAGEEMPQDSCDRDILACASHALLLKENGRLNYTDIDRFSNPFLLQANPAACRIPH
jgi:hypothetical protein